MQIMRSEANYFVDPKKARSQRVSKVSWMSSLLSLLLIAVIFVGSLGLNPSVAFAADEDEFDPGALESAFGDDADPEKVNDYIAQYEDGVETNTFQYVLGRLLLPDYINYLPHAVVGSNAREQASNIGFSPTGGNSYSDYICHDNQRGAGTPVYHNCDVPNFAAEFVQNLYSLFDRSGAQNAYALNAASILFPQFGQSKALPGGSVPADTTGASNKYTALETFGYDLQLSSYFGEWDHIQTMNQARLLTNFSFFDSVNLTAQSIGNAIGGAFDRAGAMTAEGWNTAGIFGAIGGFFGGLFEGGASDALNTMLDTSEANTVLTFGWYRANYAETAYGLRELSNQEIVAQIRYGFLSYMNATMPQDMSYDQWLKDTAPGGKIMSDPPNPPIANCTVYTTIGGGEVVHGSDKDAPPGITADECDRKQKEADKAYFDARWAGNWSAGKRISSDSIVYHAGNYYQARRTIASSETAPGSDGANFKRISNLISGGSGDKRYELGEPDKGHGRGGWDKDGARPAQSFNEWLSETKAEAGNWDASLAEYGISLTAPACTPANAGAKEEAAAKAAYTSWLSNCWTKQWEPATERNEIENQTEMNTTWLTSILTGSVLAKWAAENPGVFDFNSPWARFVCLNADGTDVTNGVWEGTVSPGDKGAPKLVSAFSADGSVNEACPQKQYRPPIQGGLLGDGYQNGLEDQNPGNDTRHISNYYGPAVSAIFPFFLQPLNSITQFMFTVGQFSTQVANEIITWTYMPILESLGIREMVENLIESLRSSIFFPLAALVVAATALYVLYQAGIKRKYRDMFISVIYVALLFIIGTALMFRPGDLINLVDRAPANVEKAVMSLILSPSISEDKLCTTGSSASSRDQGGTADWDDLNITASSQSGDINNIFSDEYNVSDDALREVLCTNWKAFVYYPWVFAQWGTSPANLDASAMQNTNDALVGDAAVDLGGSNGVINNWGVYQLKSMKLGSSTTIDWNLTGLNVKSKDFYRLVDLQAGPNNGAGTDNRYLGSWTGMDPLSRMGTGIMSAGVAVIGAVTIAAYSVTKILITFTSVFLLIFLPIVFLFGLFPTKRKFVRDYVFTLLSLMIQRVALMLMIALFLLLLMGIISTADNYLSVFLGALLICIGFLKFRKPVVDFAMSSGGAGSSAFGRLASKANGWATGMLGIDGGKARAAAWRKTGRAMKEFTPPSLQNYNDRLVAGVRNGAAGALAGAITGRGILKSADDWASRKDDLLRRTQRRTGWNGPLENAAEIKRQLVEKALKEARNDKDVLKYLTELQSELPEVEDYFKRLDQHKADLKQFNRDLADRKIIEEPALDEYGDQKRDDEGNPIMRYQRVVSRLDPETGERIQLFEEVEPPIAPEPPKIERKDKDGNINNEFTLAELGELRKFGALSEQRKSLLARKDDLRERLYATSKDESFTAQLSGDASDSEIEQLLLKAMPDSSGFTNVSRAQAREIIREMTRIDQQVNSLDKKMDTLSQEFSDRNSQREYESNPVAAQAVVVESINEDIENRERRA